MHNFVGHPNALQNPVPTDSSAVKRTELLSCEGQTVSCVEVAGRPDLDAEEFTPVLALHAGEPFSAAKIEQSVLALEPAGKFQEVRVDLRPELEGVRVLLIINL